ncbi:hypothetical protein M427DRAFT_145419 [Gonapodya prolifera JEL478]|uniref:Uncharacterized protein n=1 Tax=Gonapodya prolifera (strain JEL478) TaxID=1344416 RepID=A0A139AGZ4_GONPJ|nr:hypothetical protein M427DRAFT_145419 [Gonapodya prolifera JEL478]|eukprot:KXS15715.1 hypothetical protein M427DRAFT_145419 [Gonapodya prolifera JEL478]
MKTTYKGALDAAIDVSVLHWVVAGLVETNQSPRPSSTSATDVSFAFGEGGGEMGTSRLGGTGHSRGKRKRSKSSSDPAGEGRRGRPATELDEEMEVIFKEEGRSDADEVEEVEEDDRNAAPDVDIDAPRTENVDKEPKRHAKNRTPSAKRRTSNAFEGRAMRLGGSNYRCTYEGCGKIKRSDSGMRYHLEPDVSNGVRTGNWGRQLITMTFLKVKDHMRFGLLVLPTPQRFTD